VIRKRMWSVVWSKVGEGAPRQTNEQTSNNLHTIRVFMYESYDLWKIRKTNCT
jgi:hypothetical protein